MATQHATCSRWFSTENAASLCQHSSLLVSSCAPQAPWGVFALLDAVRYWLLGGLTDSGRHMSDNRQCAVSALPCSVSRQGISSGQYTRAAIHLLWSCGPVISVKQGWSGLVLLCEHSLTLDWLPEHCSLLLAGLQTHISKSSEAAAAWNWFRF